ncbi:unnamed protein product [Cylicocyclus nassatus]|uniref:Secreted protein n=1 Tax=Cylicocyclus nassatus TaxID=53992 RepID=A0AA36GY26_CYLNA|nr:unnamed protein product [Cylicocyclus nassatus]
MQLSHLVLVILSPLILVRTATGSEAAMVPQNISRGWENSSASSGGSGRIRRGIRIMLPPPPPVNINIHPPSWHRKQSGTEGGQEQQ